MVFVLLVLLILVLLIFLVLLVLILLIFFLLLLLFLLFQIFEELLNDVAIFGGLLVLRIDREGFGILFDRVFPICLLGLVVLGRLTAANKGVAQVIGRILAELFVFGEKRAGKVGDRLLEISHLVGRGPRIELELAGARR